LRAGAGRFGLRLANARGKRGEGARLIGERADEFAAAAESETVEVAYVSDSKEHARPMTLSAALPERSG
jgi:hypothetical protein